MRLRAYLDSREESLYAFSKRAGIPYTSLHRIINTAWLPGLRTSEKIVRASGGKVGYEDLLPAPKESKITGAA